MTVSTETLATCIDMGYYVERVKIGGLAFAEFHDLRPDHLASSSGGCPSQSKSFCPQKENEVSLVCDDLLNGSTNATTSPPQTSRDLPDAYTKYI